jgi:hypothetical protein
MNRTKGPRGCVVRFRAKIKPGSVGKSHGSRQLTMITGPIRGSPLLLTHVTLGAASANAPLIRTVSCGSRAMRPCLCIFLLLFTYLYAVFYFKAEKATGWGNDTRVLRVSSTFDLSLRELHQTWIFHIYWRFLLTEILKLGEPYIRKFVPSLTCISSVISLVTYHSILFQSI